MQMLNPTSCARILVPTVAYIIFHEQCNSLFHRFQTASNHFRLDRSFLSVCSDVNNLCIRSSLTSSSLRSFPMYCQIPQDDCLFMQIRTYSWCQTIILHKYQPHICEFRPFIYTNFIHCNGYPLTAFNALFQSVYMVFLYINLPWKM